MMSCKDVALLLSQSLDEPLTLRQRAALRFHLLVCRSCQRVWRQLRFLKDVAAHDRECETAGAPAEGLSDEARNRIREKMRKPS